MADLRALAWHDATCPESTECRDRELHAMGAPMVTSGLLDAYHEHLAVLEGETKQCGVCGQLGHTSDEHGRADVLPNDVCDICGGGFGSREAALEHVRVDHGRGPTDG